VLPDGHPEIAVEGLEDDLDGVAGGRGGRRVGGQAGQVRDGKGPADEAEALDQGGQQPEGGANDSTAGLASARVAESSTTAGASRTALMAKPPTR
jgi:hypothetical protein